MRFPVQIQPDLMLSCQFFLRIIYIVSVHRTVPFLVYVLYCEAICRLNEFGWIGKQLAQTLMHTSKLFEEIGGHIVFRTVIYKCHASRGWWPFGPSFHRVEIACPALEIWGTSWQHPRYQKVSDYVFFQSLSGINPAIRCESWKWRRRWNAN